MLGCRTADLVDRDRADENRRFGGTGVNAVEHMADSVLVVHLVVG